MSKRDRIKEILDRRERDTDSVAFLAASERITATLKPFIEMEFDIFNKEQNTHELYRYVPVSLVAAIQAYFRKTIAELIDSPHDDRYRINAKKLEKLTLNIDEAMAIGGKTVTIGELVAHSSSVNSLSSTYAVMTTLVGFDFKKMTVKLAKERSDDTSSNHDAILDEMYELRHAICHEFASKVKITNIQVFNFVTETHSLIQNADAVTMSIEANWLVHGK